VSVIGLARMDRSSSRTMLRTSLVVLLSLASLVLARPASAQSTGEYSLTSSSRFTLDLGFYYGEAPDLIGQRHGRALLVPSLAINADVLAISDDVSLSVDVQFRSVASLGRWLLEDRTDFRAGNLYGGVRVAVRPMRELRVRGGFGVVGPIMNVYDDGSLIPPVAADLAIFQVPLSALPNGAWDPWMVSRGYVPLVFRVDAEYRQDWLFFGGEAALGVGVPVLEGFEGVAIGAQLGLWGGVRPVPELAAGLRVQTVMYDEGRSSADPSAVGFFTLVPFVRGEINDVFAEARFFVNVADNTAYDAADDIPLGGLGEMAWGLYLQVGSDFDAR
jgi:hypothetical protein